MKRTRRGFFALLAGGRAGAGIETGVGAVLLLEAAATGLVVGPVRIVSAEATCAVRRPAVTNSPRVNQPVLGVLIRKILVPRRCRRESLGPFAPNLITTRGSIRW